MSTASSVLIMVHDLRSGKSKFYRILGEDGEPAGLYYMFSAPDGRSYGIFMPSGESEQNPAVYDLSSL